MDGNAEYSHAYCLFCKSGAETRTGEAIEKQIEGTKTLIAAQEKHKVLHRQREIARRTLLPGYLFLYSNNPIEVERIRKLSKVYRILGDVAQGTELYGSDKAFAEWIWMNDGIIGVSRIRPRGENDGFEILSGPMLHFSKQIVRFDKHTKNALVEMEFLNRKTEMWLAFEMVE